MKIVALEYLGDTTFCENKPNEKEIENLRYKTLEKRRKSVQEDYSTNDENSKKLDPSMEINCPNCGNRAKREGCLTICTKCGLQDQTGCSG
jgi:hypothetical protein